MTGDTFSNSPWQNVKQAVAEAITENAFPGAVLLAGRGRKVVFHQAFGHADIFNRQPMSCSTVFDLASLTKPLATALVAMHLASRGALDLDQPVVERLGGFFSSKGPRFTARMLLTHRSGLPAWQPYFQSLARMKPSSRRPLLYRMLSLEAAVYPPEYLTLYSDVGFLILEWLLEVLAGEPMAEILERSIYPQMGVHGLGFGNAIPGSGISYAAGQLCPWRCRLLKGVVDDENAFILGGAAGHAGLFGTALAVHRLVAALWRCYGDQFHCPAFETKTVRAFLTPPTGGGRALGFDVPTGDHPSCGHFFQSPTIGHLGYTGSSFWLELTTGVHVVLLTNRTHPYRFAGGIKTVRPIIHDAIRSAMADLSQAAGSLAGGAGSMVEI